MYKIGGVLIIRRKIHQTSLECLIQIPTWAYFKDVVKEQYYHVGNYDEQYTKWTILQQERDQMVSEYANKFHTLCTKLSIKDSERHLILKYRSGLHRYI